MLKIPVFFLIQKDDVPVKLPEDDGNQVKDKFKENQAGEGDVLLLRKKKKKAVKA